MTRTGLYSCPPWIETVKITVKQLLSRFQRRSVAKVPSLRVLVLGGYGQFGERICRICQTEVKRRGLGVQLLVAGRSTSRAERLVHELNHQQPVELWSDYSQGPPGTERAHDAGRDERT